MIDRVFFRLMDQLSSLFEAIGLASHQSKSPLAGMSNEDLDRFLHNKDLKKEDH